ncbi:disease resistance protein RPV1-like [Eucalyptus grandis]|uniref:disease resistance protein RPV1-like n=1 Tax=Eucalyptus grandis TaxID=71139 RepID=UPI00192E9CD9|nr:disease resistance protein RPV1-like [Eucalyptus grandis]XP_039166425.1 disease resistance protein RPV1-like [Eucalyptus grandis]XP_039166426.1 disease resistance protein RPV1-like [Eucalyptus grandis]
MNLKKLVLKDCIRLEEINSSIDQLGRLKYLEINKENRVSRQSLKRRCLMELTIPQLLVSIGSLKSLSMLKVENEGGVEGLSHSIGELLCLKHLSLHGCTKLEQLSNSIGELRLLLYLDLSCTPIRGLPDSIGRLESLLKLDLSHTLIAELPNSIGNLRQLKFMSLDGTKIRELPKSIWTLENLEELTTRACVDLVGEIPSEIAGLLQLKILDLSESKVCRLPMTINQLSSLRELVLSDCNQLQSLSNFPKRLTRLELSSSLLWTAPDLSNLTNLVSLDISDYSPDSESPKIAQGPISHPNLERLGSLHKLQMLRLVLSDSNLPPIDLSSLSRLWSLEITCADPRSLTALPSNLEILSLQDVKTPIEWPMFSNLGNLSELMLSRCLLREIEFSDVLGQLENLQRLQVRKCEPLVRLSNLASLKELRLLSVEYCPQLTEIESQPSPVGDCSSTERPIPDALKLEKLRF